MTKTLASHVAGLKLGGIVAVLMLPMLVLSYFMIAAIRDDMAFAKRELVGVELSRLIMPVAMSAATGVPAEEHIAAFRTKGAALAASIGVKNEYDTALATLVTYSKDQRYAVTALAELVGEVGTASNIILDPRAETYFLGSVLSQQAPDMLADFVSLWTLASRALKDNQITHDEVNKLLLATGSWQEAQWRVAEGIEAASQHTLDATAYKEPLEVSEEMADHPLHIARLLNKDDDADFVSAIATADEFGKAVPHMIEDLHAIWSFSADGFERLINQRLSSLQTKLNVLLAIAAAACLIGVGGAALLFRSTLRQLDVVKTARDEAEDARRESEQSFREVQRVNDDVVRLNTELADSLGKLRDAQDEALRTSKMAQMGQLTATVAHELRNPLAAVRTSAFLIERKLKGRDLGVDPQLARIANGITRCDTIITQLLDFARTKSLSVEQRDLDAWLEGVLSEEAQKLPESISLTFDAGLNGHVVSFDPARLNRVIVNLLSNAAEAMTGRPERTDKPARIDIATRLGDRGVEIAVTDNGCGMTTEVIQKALEPLFTTKSFGTGLGLPATEKILREHGGGLVIDSLPGRGTTMTGWFPVNAHSELAA